MANHREQAQFDRARWRMIILIPTWILQLILLLGLMGLFSYRLADTVDTYEDQDAKGMVPIVEVVWECTNVGLSFLSFVLTVVELAKLGSETLTPWTMLFTHVLKIVCSFAILGLDIVAYAQRADGYYSTIGLVADIVLIVVILIPGIYSILTYRRLSHFDEYHYPVNAKGYGYSGADLERNTSYSSRLSLTARPDMQRLSSASSHRSSIRSVNEPVQLQDLSRMPSYNHKRDTQFDDYVAARASLSLKDNIDRAMAAEFGWSGSPVSANEEVARRDSVVSSGMVSSARPRGEESIERHTSYDSGGLAAVPEMAEDEEEGEGARKRERKDSEASDRQALLAGHQRHDSDGGSVTMESEEGDIGNKKRKWHDGR